MKTVSQNIIKYIYIYIIHIYIYNVYMPDEANYQM